MQFPLLLWRGEFSQPHHTRFTAFLSLQIRYMSIFLPFSVWGRSLWCCAAFPLHISEAGTAATPACVICGLSLPAQLCQSGRLPGWHGHMASDQGASSITAMHYLLSSTDIPLIWYLSASAASQMLGTNQNDYPSGLICRTPEWLKLRHGIAWIEKQWPKNYMRSQTI